MRFALAPFLLVCSANAFVPSAHPLASRPSTVRSLGVDPSLITDVMSQVHHMQDFMAPSSLMLADAIDAVGDTLSTTVPDAAVATDDNGWFGFLTGPIEGLLKLIHLGVASTGTGNSWGISIILLTILIKVVTYPLQKTQLESTNKMQAMQPAIKEIQTKYQSNPEVMNQKIAEFYQTNNINPLAGCLPALVQIPIFIGLYRAVLDLAKLDKLDEPFLFLPSLEGPTYGADPTSASDWLLKGWTDAGPSLGWDDTIAFMILPVLLVISQYVSMELMQPKTDDPAQQQSNLILKVLPIMIGWFALSVPSALSVYWFVNNIVTTGLALWIKNSMSVELPKSPGGAATMEAPAQTIFAPIREKPAGFGEVQATARDDGVKPITVMDAEIVDDSRDSEEREDETGGKKQRRKSRKKKKKN